MSVLSLFSPSRKRQLMMEEMLGAEEASGQKSADGITKVRLLLLGWGTSGSGSDLSATGYSSEFPVFSRRF